MFWRPIPFFSIWLVYVISFSFNINLFKLSNLILYQLLQGLCWKPNMMHELLNILFIVSILKSSFLVPVDGWIWFFFLIYFFVFVSFLALSFSCSLLHLVVPSDLYRFTFSICLAVYCTPRAQQFWRRLCPWQYLRCYRSLGPLAHIFTFRGGKRHCFG